MPKIINNTVNSNKNRCKNWKLNRRLLIANCKNTVLVYPIKYH